MSIAKQVLEAEIEDILREHDFPVDIATHEPLSVHVTVTTIGGVVDELRVFQNRADAEQEYYRFWRSVNGCDGDAYIESFKRFCNEVCELYVHVEVE